MEVQKNKNNRTLIFGSLLFASLIFCGWLGNLNRINKEKLNIERLKEDSILSTKLLLDKEIINLNNEITLNLGKNKRLDSLLLVSNLTIQEKVKQIKSLTKENASVKSLKKELKDLRNLKVSLTQKIDQLNIDNKRLANENEILTQKVNNLEAELDKAKKQKPSAAVVAQNFRVEMQKKNAEKLTAKIKRTKRIQITLNLIGKGSQKEQTLYVKIIDPNGYVVNPNITPVVIKEEKIIYSLVQKVSTENDVNKTTISISPDKKMKQKGIYKILIYNESDGLIGSSEIKMN